MSGGADDFAAAVGDDALGTGRSVEAGEWVAGARAAGGRTAVGDVRDGLDIDGAAGATIDSSGPRIAGGRTVCSGTEARSSVGRLCPLRNVSAVPAPSRQPNAASNRRECPKNFGAERFPPKAGTRGGTDEGRGADGRVGSLTGAADKSFRPPRVDIWLAVFDRAVVDLRPLFAWAAGGATVGNGDGATWAGAGVLDR